MITGRYSVLTVFEYATSLWITYTRVHEVQVINIVVYTISLMKYCIGIWVLNKYADSPPNIGKLIKWVLQASAMNDIVSSEWGMRKAWMHDSMSGQWACVRYMCRRARSKVHEQSCALCEQFMVHVCTVTPQVPGRDVLHSDYCSQSLM